MKKIDAMRKILLIFVVLMLSIQAKAENGDIYQIKFTIETIDGKVENGYSTIYIDMDSLKNTQYLIRTLNWWEVDDSSFIYFKDRIEYEYRSWIANEQKSKEYQLLNKKSISRKDIKLIKITELIDASLYVRISTPLQLKDTTWIKKEPIKRVRIGEYTCNTDTAFYGYCNHEIFIHVNSKKNDMLIKQLELVQIKIDKLNSNFENGDYDDSDIENAREICDEIWRVFGEFRGEKVVIIDMCTD